MPKPTNEDLQILFNRPPADAIAYLENKGFKIGWDWHQTLDDAHSRAFTVAKVAKLDLLHDMRQSLIKALEQGQSFDKWRAELEPNLRAQGWWGKKTVINPEGQEQQVQLGSSRRLRTIYHTNMRSAYSAGRYKTMLASLETRPYWEYRHVTMVNYREKHKSWNGVILRGDDPFWTVAYPQSEFGCNCYVIARSAREVEGKEILSSEGYQTQYSEKIGVDSFTGQDVYGTRQRFDIPSKDGVLSFSPAAGFNNSPATSAAIDQVLVRRATRTLGHSNGLAIAQQIMLAPVRQRAYQAFVDNTLSIGKAQKQSFSIGVPQAKELARLHNRKSIRLDGAIIQLSDNALLMQELTQAELLALPESLASAQHVFWHEASQQLVYRVSVFDQAYDVYVTEQLGVLQIVRFATLNDDGLELIR